MIAAITVAAVTSLALAVSVLFKPEVKIKKFTLPLYPLIALCGAVFSLLLTPLSFKDCIDAALGAGSVNPLKILAVFISVTAISVFLDEAGFFEFLASRTLSRAGGSQKKLFFLLYAIVSVLTVFTSNDIVILTFTPFILFFCKNSGVKPMPYLIAQFTAANTWSMMLVIGNPTNIYLASSAGIGFFDYFKVMALPTFFAGGAALGVLYLIFRKSLAQPFRVADTERTPIKDMPFSVLGVCVLGVCTVMLAVSGYIGVEMWIECLVAVGVLLIAALVIAAARRKKPIILLQTVKRLPYWLIPFVLSMFVVSLALTRTGVTQKIAEAFSVCELPLYGVASFFASNFLNNIPMSILFSSVIAEGEAGPAAVFASVIGSNLGALLTPAGALAGIMFSSLVRRHGETFTPLTFIRYGSVISLVTLAAALSMLCVTMLF